MKRSCYLTCTILFLLLVNFTANPENRVHRFVVVDYWHQSKDKKKIQGWDIYTKKKPAGINIESGILQLRSRSSSFGLTRKMDLSLKEYPYLSWEWKISELPEKGDFRKKKTDDQAGQVYIFFSRFPVFGRPEIFADGLGYLWDNMPPRGTTGRSPAWFKLKCLVLRNNKDQTGVWVKEKRNIYEDYKKIFKKEPPPVIGMGIYINSQHTKSGARASYRSIYFSKE